MPSRTAAKKTGKQTSIKPSTKASNHRNKICDVCCTDVIEGKDEALQYEGPCQKWLHRYCAGVPKYHYEMLSNNSTLFVCWACSQKLHRKIVVQLQSKINAMEELLTAIKSEMSELRRSHMDNNNMKNASPSWANVVNRSQ